MFSTTLFITVPNWKQPTCQRIAGLINYDTFINWIIKQLKMTFPCGDGIVPCLDCININILVIILYYNVIGGTWVKGI